MPECVITSVDNDDSLFRPVIANFQNGQLQPDQVDKLQCVAFSNKKNKNRVIVAATEKMTYVGTDSSDNDLCYTLLTIRNKRTNKVRIVPVSNISLKAVVPNLNSSLDGTLNNTKSSIMDLNKQFGSKRARLKTEQNERMRMNVSNVEQELKQAVADIEIKPEDLVIPKHDEEVKFYRPPMNRNASMVDQIYDLDDIITKEELDTLAEIADTLTGETFEADKYIPFVSENIHALKNSKSEDKIKKIQLLLYIDAILKFFKINARLIGKKPLVLEQYPDTICKKIMQEFTVCGDHYRTRPISMRDKATCYCIIIGLIVMDYVLNLESLSKSMGVGVKKLFEISRVLGAQPFKSSKTTIVLKLPLPTQPVFSSKRKK